MKSITLLILAFLAVGCQADQADIDQNHNIVVIDGCEYITYQNALTGSNNYSFAITHKGNCKNPVHQHDCN